MKITGAVSLSAEPKQVWGAIHDPAVLARTLPGCESLTELGTNRYQMSITAGVAAVRGTYDGTVSLEDLEEPTTLRMRASGAGAPGTIEADVAVSIEGCEDGGTRVTYQADAEVGGPIGGVGQRMLSGVTKKMAGQFFAALDADIAGVRPEERAVAATPVGARVGTTAPEAGTGGEPRVFTGRAPAKGPSVDTGFALGVAVGGLLALIGVALGARIARR
jgi:uncharacterized protein